MWRQPISADLTVRTTCSHYGWKAFGFDGKQQPIWTIAGYVDMVENYEDPSDYVGMGWVGSDGRP
jgi:hypothetical protein